MAWCVIFAAVHGYWAAGGLDPRPPLVLLLIEPWFAVGGLAFAAVAWGMTRASSPATRP